jgi:adenylyltransferase/sulfurtransferase
MPADLSDGQLERYSRQILLPQIDLTGQARLLDAHVVIVGVGGLGSPAAIYLACSGIGKLTLCDADRVEPNNLHRQIAHQTDDIGRPKTASARQHLLALNPDIDIDTVNDNVNDDNVATLIQHADCVIDASDNFATRYIINRACYNAGKPLVSGSAIRMQGQVAIFNATSSSPCYQCLYPEDLAMVSGSCSDSGILPPVVGMIGSVMATETIKLLLRIGAPLDGHLLTLDAETMAWKRLTLMPDPDCPLCGQHRRSKTVL